MSAALPGDSCLRPDPLTAIECAQARRLRQINDTRKLAALLPTWVKSHLKAGRLPRPQVFVPNAPPAYPAWACRSLRPIWTPADRNIPVGEFKTVAKYVRAFEELNGLRSV